MGDNGGFENWDMVILEEYEFEKKYQLHLRERHWIEELKPILNSATPTGLEKRNEKKYLEDYKQMNDDALKQKNKEYREANKEKISETKKRCYEKKKAEYAEANKKYREENKDAINEK